MGSGIEVRQIKWFKGAKGKIEVIKYGRSGGNEKEVLGEPVWGDFRFPKETIEVTMLHKNISTNEISVKKKNPKEYSKYQKNKVQPNENFPGSKLMVPF